jgi:hypothetical protein
VVGATANGDKIAGYTTLIIEVSMLTSALGQLHVVLLTFIVKKKIPTHKPSHGACSKAGENNV